MSQRMQIVSLFTSDISLSPRNKELPMQLIRWAMFDAKFGSFEEVTGEPGIAWSYVVK